MTSSNQQKRNGFVPRSRSAVVLGGGGLSAVGWSTGVLAALEEHCALQLSEQDVVIGTSAGAAVAAVILQSGSASSEFDSMVRKSRRSPELSPVADLEQIFPQVMEIHEAQGSLGDKVNSFMRLSRQVSGIDADTRRSAIAERLHATSWPDHELRITAVGEDGATHVFTQESGANLIDVVTASCAVPGLWPVVTIGGKDFLDGGTFSLTNAELAGPAEDVLVLQPMPENPGYDAPGRAEVLARATVLQPSDRAREGFGTNPFDPDVRGVAAVLGYEDALEALRLWRGRA